MLVKKWTIPICLALVGLGVAVWYFVTPKRAADLPCAQFVAVHGKGDEIRCKEWVRVFPQQEGKR